ncbi:MAG: thiamine pyrophosphate-dependent enzyme, partial [Candidatus Hodarchaeota archaeon]
LFKQIIIIEEGDSYLEANVLEIYGAHHWTHVQILGRKQLITPEEGELNNKIVQEGLIQFFFPEEAKKTNTERKVGYKDTKNLDDKYEHLRFPRPPVLCPGCPHRATFYALSRATKGGRTAVFSTDIGCYTLGVQAPLNVGDVSICMGSSLGIGAGLATTPIKEKPIALIGDSTFWHTGLPGLANAAYNQTNMLVVIVDNFTTAMTGMQEHPGTGKTAMKQDVRRLSIPDVVRGMGVEFLEIVNSYSVDETRSAFDRALKHKGLAVVISQGECMLHLLRRRRRKIPLEGLDWNPPELKVWSIDPEVCVGCGRCVIRFGCPAIIWSDQETDKGRRIPLIDTALCNQCGVCSQVCPHEAIKSEKT